MEKKPKCKICRRAGKKLFLKGEKCNTQKCPMITKPYPPGIKGKRRMRGLSEYGKQLKEKQKLKNWYNLGERQFKKYVMEVLEKAHKGSAKVGDAAEALIRKLESRLDNIVYRLGFASSRTQARQLVSHAHFLVNGKPVNIPSMELKKGDKISVRPSSIKKPAFQNLSSLLKKYQPPAWLKLDSEKLEGEVIGVPSLEIAAPPAEIPAIFEFYSK
jgi:small subunit ribosomal protein S4